MADQYYIEQDYFDGKYFGVIFDAVISLNPYIEEGYYDGDYYVPTGGQASLSCTAEVVTGVTVEANGSPTSNFTLTFSITRIKPLSATLTAQASVTALASKLNDIDIYAFAEGQLSSSVGAIRDYEIAASSQFSISIDYVRRRQADSDSDIVTSISIDIERYREIDSAQQVAFSFAVAETKFRPGNADLTSTAALTATISNIAGADIVAENFASISCDAVKTTDVVSQFENAVTVSATVGKNVIASATLSSHAVLFVSRNVGTNPPVTITGTFNSTELINSATRISNLESLAFDNWF